jgi:hypothetical protein
MLLAAFGSKLAVKQTFARLRQAKNHLSDGWILVFTPAPVSIRLHLIPKHLHFALKFPFCTCGRALLFSF